ncbi:unnamed protein product [Vicia faba]|uniref:Uncharacterized protein n=1 Tax=Vicia faba TaxID=3906 RepID=A0AAV0Z0M3_VICFA|nr:unnamed protein product [Vicia faba]
MLICSRRYFSFVVGFNNNLSKFFLVIDLLDHLEGSDHDEARVWSVYECNSGAIFQIVYNEHLIAKKKKGLKTASRSPVRPKRTALSCLADTHSLIAADSEKLISESG